MREVFLNLFLKELSIKYKGYIVVPVPSYIADDERRGFNPVKKAVFLTEKLENQFFQKKTQFLILHL